MTRKRKPGGRELPDKGKPRGRRPNDARPLRPRFLIVCEGTQTEPNYFRRFRANAEIEVVGLGQDPVAVVNRAYQEMKQKAYAQVWAVFDRDTVPAERFNEALRLAKEYGIKVACSNEAFELWFWLHFDYQDTAVARAAYQAKLTERLGRPYRKNDRQLYDLLLDSQPIAVQNAKRLLASYGPDLNPERANPSTTVHLLVQELNASQAPLGTGVEN